MHEEGAGEEAGTADGNMSSNTFTGNDAALRPFLDYTQSSKPFVICSAHRVIRRRLRVMAELAGPSEKD